MHDYIAKCETARVLAVSPAEVELLPEAPELYGLLTGAAPSTVAAAQAEVRPEAEELPCLLTGPVSPATARAQDEACVIDAEAKLAKVPQVVLSQPEACEFGLKKIVSADQSAHVVKKLEEDHVESVKSRMEVLASNLGLTSARFLPVESDYYQLELEERVKRVGAGSTDELVKSLIMENTKIGADSASDPRRVRRVLVMVQYGPNAKTNQEKIHKVVKELEASRGLPALGKKQYNFRMLDAEVTQEFTGFGHNAVTPLGLDLPIIVSHRIAALPSDSIYIGGGHVDLKLNISVTDIKDKLGAIIADVTG